MKQRSIDIAISITAGALILSLSVGLWLLPSKDFSEEENRLLSPLPSLRLSTLTDGSFSQELGDFLRDRLPLRLNFIRLKTLSELLLLKGEAGGVIFCRDGYLLLRGEYESLDRAQRSLSEISDLRQALTEKGIPTNAIYLPRGIDVMSGKLPLLYRGNEGDILQLIEESKENIDLLPLLRDAAETGEQVWFRTDHHWTSHGAYIAYVYLSSMLGYTPYEKDFFYIETISENFLGSVYSRAGCIAPPPDTVDLYRYEGDDQYRLIADDTTHHKGLYFFDLLGTKDKYSIFLGGNYARLTVEKEADEERPRLLLIKDSYANALVPFLALHFDIELIDPRFYSGFEEIYEMVENVDYVLIIQGVDTIAT